MSFRNGFYAGLILAVGWGVYVALLWRAERQVELHSVHLLEKIEKRKWKAVGEHIGAEYEDRWGNDRARLLKRLPDVFRVLPNANIEASSPAIRTEQGRGFWIAKITIKSSGGEFSDYIKERVNSLQTPFEFEWKRGEWPWNWTLISVRNSELEIRDY